MSMRQNLPSLSQCRIAQPPWRFRNFANTLEQGCRRRRSSFTARKTAHAHSWLDELPVKVQAKCLLRVERLSELGHELRRTEADLLRDGIYDLRASLQGVHYRILYFFNGAVAAVVAHGIVKERAVPFKEIDRAIERKKRRVRND